MILPRLTALLGLSSTALAQTEIVWGSVVYTYHGEKIPSLTSGPYNLSPLGANQMLEAGAFLRSRSIDPGNGTQYTGSAPINGLSVYAIDNSQLYALSTDDEFISGSATAFFQGLYPPRGIPIFDAEDSLANGTNLGFPLDNYQYPNIGTISELDFNYIWIAGNIGCTNWAIAQVEELESSSTSAQVAATQEFYNGLASTVFWNYDPNIVNYENAWFLYEYALYQYNHNESRPISSKDLSQLYNLASQQQFDINTPNTFGTIPAIAGASLASFVLQQLDHVIASGGVADKLTLLFGSYEPFLAFFALSNLSTGPSAQMFNNLPLHGSMMAFELFSNPTSTSSGENLTTAFPSTDELMVRFLFRNGTADTAPIVQYPLFGLGNSQDDMSWMDFVQDMGTFSLDDVSEWCTSCNSITLFCEAIELDTSNSTDTDTSTKEKKTLSPAIGGVIGATVTLAIALLVVLILGLCGFRLEFHGKRKTGAADVGGIGVLKRNGSGTGGGFKGAEKLASDTDLRLKGGAGATVVRHERVGSWELNDSPTDKKNGSLDKDVESGRIERVVSGADYGRRSVDTLDPFGDPVKPVDQV